MSGNLAVFINSMMLWCNQLFIIFKISDPMLKLYCTALHHIVLYTGPDHGTSGPWGLKATAGPSYIYLQYWPYLSSIFTFTPLLRNVDYVKNNYFCTTCSKTTQVGMLYKIRETWFTTFKHQHCLQQSFTGTSTFDNFDQPVWYVKTSNYNLEQTMTWLNKH